MQFDDLTKVKYLTYNTDFNGENSLINFSTIMNSDATLPVNYRLLDESGKDEKFVIDNTNEFNPKFTIQKTIYQIYNELTSSISNVHFSQKGSSCKEYHLNITNDGGNDRLMISILFDTHPTSVHYGENVKSLRKEDSDAKHSQKQNPGVFKNKSNNGINGKENLGVGKSVPKIERISPFEQSIREGSSVNIICKVSGLPEIKTEWYYGDTIIESDDDYLTFTDNDKFTLQIKEIYPIDEGNYRLKATNENGSTTCEFHLNCIEQTTNILNKTKDEHIISLLPNNFQKNATGTEVLKEIIEPKTVIQMTTDITEEHLGELPKEVVEPQSIEEQTIKPITEKSKPKLEETIEKEMVEEVKESEVIVTEEQSVVVEETLIDEAPKISPVNTEQVEFAEGSPATLQCTFTGQPKPKIQWFYGKDKIEPDEDYEVETIDNITTLKIKEAFSEDAGNYFAKAVNTLGVSKCKLILNKANIIEDIQKSKEKDKEQFTPIIITNIDFPCVVVEKNRLILKFEEVDKNQIDRQTTEPDELKLVEHMENDEKDDIQITETSKEEILPEVETFEEKDSTTVSEIIENFKPKIQPNYQKPIVTMEDNSLTLNVTPEIMPEVDKNQIDQQTTEPDELKLVEHMENVEKDDVKELDTAKIETLSAVVKIEEKDSTTVSEIVENFKPKIQQIDGKPIVTTEDKSLTLNLDVTPEIMPEVYKNQIDLQTTEPDELKLVEHMQNDEKDDIQITETSKEETLTAVEKIDEKDSTTVSEIIENFKPKIQQIDGKPIVTMEDNSLTLNHVLPEGNVSITISLKDLTYGASDDYICIIKTDDKEKIFSWKLFVVELPNIKNLRSIYYGQVGKIFKIPFNVFGMPEPTVTFDHSINNMASKIQMTRNKNFVEVTLGKYIKTFAGSLTIMAKNRLGTVNEQVEIMSECPPKFLDHPSEFSAEENKDYQVKLFYTGFPSPDIKWTKSYDTLKDGKRHGIVNESDYTMLTIRNCDKNDSGEYKVTLSNRMGKVSSTYKMLILSKPKFTTTLNEKIEVKEGRLLKLSTKFNGHPSPRVDWFANGINVSSKMNDFINTTKNTSDITIKNANSELSGIYRCELSNDFGSDATECSVQIQCPPKFLEKPDKIKLVEKCPGSVSCIVQAIPSADVTWSFNGKPIKSSDSFSFSNEDNCYTLCVNNVTKVMSGLYNVTAKNIAGKCVEKFRIETIEPSSPKFIKPLSDVKIPVGIEHVWTVKYQGLPRPTLNIEHDGQDCDFFVIKDDVKKGITSLTLADSEEIHQGSYKLKIINPVGKAECEAMLMVKGIKAKIIEVPQRSITNFGSTVVFSSKIIGDPLPKVTWKKGRNLLGSKPKKIEQVFDEENLTAFLIITNIGEGDPGTYTIEIENEFGSDTSAVTLMIDENAENITDFSDILKATNINPNLLEDMGLNFKLKHVVFDPKENDVEEDEKKKKEKDKRKVREPKNYEIDDFDYKLEKSQSEEDLKNDQSKEEMQKKVECLKSLMPTDVEEDDSALLTTILTGDVNPEKLRLKHNGKTIPFTEMNDKYKVKLRKLPDGETEVEICLKNCQLEDEGPVSIELLEDKEKTELITETFLKVTRKKLRFITKIEPNDTFLNEHDSIKFKVSTNRKTKENEISWKVNNSFIEMDNLRYNIKSVGTEHQIQISKVEKDKDDGIIQCLITDDPSEKVEATLKIKYTAVQFTEMLNDVKCKINDEDVHLSCSINKPISEIKKVVWLLNGKEVKSPDIIFNSIDDMFELIWKKINKNSFGKYSIKLIDNDDNEIDSSAAIVQSTVRIKFTRNLEDITVNEYEDVQLSCDTNVSNANIKWKINGVPYTKANFTDRSISINSKDKTHFFNVKNLKSLKFHKAEIECSAINEVTKCQINVIKQHLQLKESKKLVEVVEDDNVEEFIEFDEKSSRMSMNIKPKIMKEDYVVNDRSVRCFFNSDIQMFQFIINSAKSHHAGDYQITFSNDDESDTQTFVLTLVVQLREIYFTKIFPESLVGIETQKIVLTLETNKSIPAFFTPQPNMDRYILIERETMNGSKLNDRKFTRIQQRNSNENEFTMLSVMNDDAGIYTGKIILPVNSVSNKLTECKCQLSVSYDTINKLKKLVDSRVIRDDTITLQCELDRLPKDYYWKLNDKKLEEKESSNVKFINTPLSNSNIRLAITIDNCQITDGGTYQLYVDDEPFDSCELTVIDSYVQFVDWTENLSCIEGENISLKFKLSEPLKQKMKITGRYGGRPFEGNLISDDQINYECSIKNVQKIANGGRYVFCLENDPSAKLIKSDVQTEIQIQLLITDKPIEIVKNLEKEYEVNEDETIQLEFELSHPFVNVNWMKNNDVLNKNNRYRISNIDTKYLLTIRNATDKDIGTYNLKLSDGIGGSLEDSCSLKVLPKLPEWTMKLEDEYEVFVFDSLNLDVELNREKNIKFEWMIDDELLLPKSIKADEFVKDCELSYNGNRTQLKNRRIQINNFPPEEFIVYRLTVKATLVSFHYPSITSETRLIIRQLQPAFLKPLRLKRKHGNIIEEGEAFVLECKVNRKDVNLRLKQIIDKTLAKLLTPGDDDHFVVQRDDDGLKWIFKLFNSKATDEGNFVAEIENYEDIKSQCTVVIQERPLEYVCQPISVLTVMEDDILKIKFAVNKPIDIESIELFKNDEKIKINENNEINDEFFVTFTDNFQTVELTKKPASLDDEAVYRVTCEKIKSKNCKVSVQESLPVILQELSNIEIEEEQSIELECELNKISSFKPKWTMDNVEIFPHIDTRVEQKITEKTYTMKIDKAKLSDGGNYSFILSDGKSSIRSSCTVSVKEKPIKFTKTLTDIELTENEQLFADIEVSERRNCRVVFQTQLTNNDQWQKIPVEKKGYDLESKGKSFQLTIDHVSLMMNGKLKCFIQNTINNDITDECESTVIVHESAPKFVKFFENLTDKENSNIKFEGKLDKPLKNDDKVEFLLNGNLIESNEKYLIEINNTNVNLSVRNINLSDNKVFMVKINGQMEHEQFRYDVEEDNPEFLKKLSEKIEIEDGSEQVEFECSINKSHWKKLNKPIQVEWVKTKSFGSCSNASEVPLHSSLKWNIEQKIEQNPETLNVKLIVKKIEKEIDNSMYICCRIRSESSNDIVNSSISQLIVLERPLKFDMEIKDYEINEGSNCTIECQMNKEMENNTDVQWYLDGKLLSKSSNMKFVQRNKLFQLKIGEVTSELSGRIKCKIQNIESEGSLKVKIEPIKWRKTLQDTTVNEGDECQLQCQCERIYQKRVDIKWLKNGEEIDIEKDRKYKCEFMKANCKIILKVKETQLMDDGKWTCVINDLSKTSAQLTVIPIPLEFSQRFTDQNVEIEKECRLDATLKHAMMNPIKLLLKLHNETVIEMETEEKEKELKKIDRYNRELKLSVDNKRSLHFTIPQVVKDDDGDWTLEVECGKQKIRTNCNMKVEKEALYFIKPLNDLKIEDLHKTSVEFVCQLNRSLKSTDSLKWYRKVNNSTEYEYLKMKSYYIYGDTFQFQNSRSIDKFTLILHDVTSNDLGIYKATVDDSISTEAILQLIVPPTIKAETGGGECVRIASGKSLTLKYKYRGEPSPNIELRFNNEKLENFSTDNNTIQYIAATVSNNGVKRQHSGTYTATASNCAGTANCDIEIVVLDVPSICRQFKCKQIKDEVVYSWLKPEDDGGNKIISYELQKCFKNKPGKWTPLKSITIDDLDSEKSMKNNDELSYPISLQLPTDETYQFRICAENRNGKSEYTSLKDDFTFMAWNRVPAKCNPPKISNIMKDSCWVEWEPPEDYGSSPITQFTIEKRLSTSKRWTKVGRTIEECQIEAKDLISDEQYEFRVISTNSVGNSEPSDGSEMVRIQYQFKPPDPPMELKIEDVTDNYIDIKFLPSTSDNGSPLTNYTISIKEMPLGRYREYGKIVDDKTLSLKFSETNSIKYHMGGLRKNYKYMMKVTAANLAGISSPIESGTIEVKNQVSGKPPKIVEEIQNIVTVANETICLRCAVSGKPFPTIKWYHEDNELFDENHQLDSREECSFVIEKIKLRQAGLYRCIAKNELGTCSTEGKVEIVEKPKIEVDSKNIEVEENRAVQLKFRLKSDSDITKILFSNSDHSFTIPVTNRNFYCYSLGKAKKEWTGNYKLKVENIASSSEIDLKLKVLTVPSIVNSFKCSSVTTRNITFSWSIPSDDGGTPITHYEIKRLLPKSDDMWIPVKTVNYVNDQLSYEITIDDVKWKNETIYGILAVNRIGESDIEKLDDGISLKKEDSLAPPEDIKVSNVNEDGCDIDWTWKGRDPKLKGFTIEAKEIDDYDSGIWKKVHRGILKDRNSYRIGDNYLTINSSYIFRVNAISDTSSVPSRESDIYKIKNAESIPSPPTISSVNISRNVNCELKWKEPIRSGGTTIRGYYVEYRIINTNFTIKDDGDDDDKKEWIRCNDSSLCRHNDYLITELEFDTIYIFRVAAVNRVGMGPWSLPSTQFRTASKEMEEKPKILIEKKWNFQMDKSGKMVGRVQSLAPILEVEWTKSYRTLLSNKVTTTFADGEAVLYFSTMTEKDGGYYELMARNVNGETTEQIEVSIESPAEIIPDKRYHLSKQKIEVGETFRFIATIRGIPEPKIYWKKDRSPLEFTDNCRGALAASLYTLTFKNCTYKHSGEYIIYADNGASSLASYKFEIAVVDVPSIPRGPLYVNDVTETGATILWKNSVHDNNSPINKYSVEKRTISAYSDEKIMGGSFGNWLHVQNVNPNVVGQGVLVKTSLSTLTEFRVKAHNDIGESEPLISEEIIPMGMESAPNTPIGPVHILRCEGNIDNVNSAFDAILKWSSANAHIFSHVQGLNLSHYVIEERQLDRWVYVGRTSSADTEYYINNSNGIYRIYSVNERGERSSTPLYSHPDYDEHNLQNIPPDCPLGPISVTSRTSNNISIQWGELLTGSTVDNYVIEIRGTMDDDWVECCRQHFTSTSCTLRDLLPNTDYNIRIFAENQYGKSLPLKCKVLVSTLKSFECPSAPEGPLQYSIDNYEVRLRWHASRNNGGSSIREYIIERKDVARDRWIKDGAVSSNTFNYTMKNLLPTSKYLIRIIANNDIGMSEQLECDDIICIEDRNKLIPNKPIGPISINEDDDSININWMFDEQTPIKKSKDIWHLIQLQKWKKDENGSMKTDWVVVNRVSLSSSPTNELNYRLLRELLMDETEINIRIIAENQIGNQSEYLHLEEPYQLKFATKVAPVQNIKVDCLSNGVIFVEWTQISSMKVRNEYRSQPIKEYLLEYRTTDRNWQELCRCPSFETTHSIENIFENFELRITAIDINLKRSDPTNFEELIHPQKKSSIPLAPTGHLRLSADEKKLIWKGCWTFDELENIDYFKIESRNPNKIEWQEIGRSQQHLMEADIDNLGVDYVFDSYVRIIAGNGYGESVPLESKKPIESQSSSLLPVSPENFEVIDIDSNIVKLKWTLPRSSYEKRPNYLIIEAKDYRWSVWKQLKRLRVVTSCDLDDLKADNKYTIRIYSQNSNGKSKHQPQLTFTTLPSNEIPSTPERFQQDSLNANEINWYCDDENSKNFVLKFFNSHQCDWEKIGEIETSLNRRYKYVLSTDDIRTILNRTANDELKFQLFSINSNGLKSEPANLNNVDIQELRKLIFNLNEVDELPPPEKPLTITAVGLDTVKMTWNKPIVDKENLSQWSYIRTQKDLDSFISSYVIERKLITSFSSNWQHISTINNVNKTECEIPGQENDASYRYRIKSVSNRLSLQSKPLENGEIFIFKSPFDVPEIPSAIRLVEFDDNSVKISWDAPFHDGGQNIIDYLVERRDIRSQIWLQCDIVRHDDTKQNFQTTIKQLQSNCSYKIRICARNVIGTSNHLLLDNDITISGQVDILPPKLFQIDEIKNGEASLSWVSPSSIERDVYKEISYELEQQINGEKWKIIKRLPIKQTTFTTSQLKDNCKYRFRIRVYILLKTIEKYSEYVETEPILVRTKSNLPLAPSYFFVRRIGDSFFELQWQNMEDNDLTNIVEFELDIMNTNYISNYWSTLTTVPYTISTYFCKNLTKKTIYNCRIRSRNPFGVSEWKELPEPIEVLNRFMPPPPPLGPIQISNITRETADISWMAPMSSDCLHSPVTSYFIEKCQLSRNIWVKVARVTSDITSVRVQNMLENNEHQIRIQAENTNGVSDFLVSDNIIPNRTSENSSKNFMRQTGLFPTIDALFVVQRLEKDAYLFKLFIDHPLSSTLETLDTILSSTEYDEDDDDDNI
ncbi:hypothetical protein SNEBB_002425 [Seison nebaliae]|nr:hypothetical protein SNEBB_002425 [Seison nebaliae]